MTAGRPGRNRRPAPANTAGPGVIAPRKPRRITALKTTPRHPSFAAAVAAGAAVGSYDTPFARTTTETWQDGFALLNGLVGRATRAAGASSGGRASDLPDRSRLTLTDAQVDHFVTILKETGVPQFFDNRIQETKKAAGRPARFTPLAALVAFWACATNQRRMHLAEATDILVNGITPRSQALLGVTRQTLAVPAAARTLKERVSANGGRGRQTDEHCDRAAAEVALGRTFKKMTTLIDPSNLPSNRRLPHAEAAQRIAPIDDATRTQRQRDLDWVCNRLIQASWRMIPRELRRQFTGSACIDATPLPVNSRPATPHYSSAEPNAGLYLRRNALTGEIMKKFQAYDVHAAMSGDDRPGSVQHVPGLFMGMTSDRPGVDPAGAARRLLALIAEARVDGLPLGPSPGRPAYLAGDRLYGEQNAGLYQNPAAELGWLVVHDYKDNALGNQGSHHGMQLVDGGWHCPALLQNKRLVDASADYRAKKITWEKYQALIKERSTYAMRIKAKRTPTTPERLRCPAAGKDATAVCALKPASKDERRTRQADGSHADSRTQITPTGPAFAKDGAAPSVCRHDSVPVTITDTPKHWQHLPYGTPLWADTYKALRATQEGTHGHAKDGAKEALADPSRRRVRGKAAQTLLAAFILTAVNIRKIRSFLDNAVTDPATGMLVCHKKQQARPDRWTAPNEPVEDPYVDEPAAPDRT